MIHFLPEPEAGDVVQPADALARIAGLNHALAAAERLRGNVPIPCGHRAAAAWPSASEAQQALCETMSAHAVAGSVAGLEALAMLRDAGLEANRAAIDTLTASIKDELNRLGHLLTL